MNLSRVCWRPRLIIKFRELEEKEKQRKKTNTKIIRSVSCCSSMFLKSCWRTMYLLIYKKVYAWTPRKKERSMQIAITVCHESTSLFAREGKWGHYEIKEIARRHAKHHLTKLYFSKQRHFQYPSDYSRGYSSRVLTICRLSFVMSLSAGGYLANSSFTFVFY